MESFYLDCRECGRVTVLSAAAQVVIIRELKLPSQRKLVDCPCGRFQFVLGAEIKKRFAATEAIHRRFT